uniref:Integrase catalytic domain-containing protein n=1 Tax=Triticum urartu TaxID=4572 RepID=A0A8R7PKD4_TRIUA
RGCQHLGEQTAFWSWLTRSPSNFFPVAHPLHSSRNCAALYRPHHKQHGIPDALVSNKDLVFTSKVWQTIFKLQWVDLKMSSAHHPQTGGQTERVNQCPKTYLRCYVQSAPKTWSKWLALAEFWYNTAFHSMLGKTPFMVVYGQEPKQLGITSYHAAPLPELNSWLEERQ